MFPIHKILYCSFKCDQSILGDVFIYCLFLSYPSILFWLIEFHLIDLLWVLGVLFVCNFLFRSCCIPYSVSIFGFVILSTIFPVWIYFCWACWGHLDLHSNIIQLWEILYLWFLNCYFFIKFAFVFFIDLNGSYIAPLEFISYFSDVLFISF